MSTVKEIQDAIGQLSVPDQVALRDWFAERDAVEWDRELESDVAAGRLDWLLNEARNDLRAGRCTDR
jgi:hypothetical protein